MSEICLVLKVYGCSVERFLKCGFHNGQVAHNSARREKGFIVLSSCVRLLNNNLFKNLSFSLRLMIRLLIWNSAAVCPVQIIFLYCLINFHWLVQSWFT